MTNRYRKRFWVMAGCAVLALFIGSSAGVSQAFVTLTVVKTGNGTVTSSPAGINCGTTCSASFARKHNRDAHSNPRCWLCSAKLEWL
jgi:hypothetical protein